MHIDPKYGAIGRFFADNPVFTILMYQRGYAGEKQEIDDFLKDLEDVFKARKAERPKNHFLGSIVTVQYKLSGVVGKNGHELVDGQQGATTFVLLAAAICEQYKHIMSVRSKDSNKDAERIAQNRLSVLKNRFIEFEQEVNRKFSNQRVFNPVKSR